MSYKAINAEASEEFFVDSGDLLDKTKAAIAYCLHIELNKPQNEFMWSCGAFRALCEIKANATHGENAIERPRILRGEVYTYYQYPFTDCKMYVSLKPNRRYIRSENVD